MAAEEGRVQPLERQGPRPRGIGDRGADRLQAGLELAPNAGGTILDPGRLAEPVHVRQHLAEGARVLLQHPRPPRQTRRHRDHILVGDGADLADRLGDDQLRLQFGQPFLVERVEGAPFADDLLYRRVDLAGIEIRGKDRRGQVRQLGRCRREVALVGDADHVPAETEREEHLGRGGDEAGDAHQATISPPPAARWHRRPSRLCWDGSGRPRWSARAAPPSGSSCPCRRRGRCWFRTS